MLAQGQGSLVHPAHRARRLEPRAVDDLCDRHELHARIEHAVVVHVPGSRHLLLEALALPSCGGGGYGAPTERPAAQVAIDVRERWVSPEAARETYRVALDDAGALDQDATARLRNG